MAQQPVADVSRKSFSVAYDGHNRADDHTIDVDVLAPALLAFGRLVREANKEANGKSATARVLVVSDFEHKCFNVNFDVVLTLYEQARQLVGLQKVKDAKDILEWLDLIVGGTVASGLGFLGYLRWKRGRKVEDVSQITDTDQAGMVAVRVAGERNHVVIHNHTYNLSNNPKALAAARDALSPIGSDGFDNMTLRDDGKVVRQIEKDEADAIITSCVSGIEESKDLTPNVEETTAWLTVYSPVFEATAETWRFKLGQEVIYADISETTIAQDAVTRGGAMMDDTYQVRLEITIPTGAIGKSKKPSYRVLKVLRFLEAPPSGQDDLPLED